MKDQIDKIDLLAGINVSIYIKWQNLQKKKEIRVKLKQNLKETKQNALLNPILINHKKIS